MSADLTTETRVSAGLTSQLRGHLRLIDKCGLFMYNFFFLLKISRCGLFIGPLYSPEITVCVISLVSLFHVNSI